MNRVVREDCKTLYATYARYDGGGTTQSEGGMEPMQTMKTMMPDRHRPT